MTTTTTHHDTDALDQMDTLARTLGIMGADDATLGDAVTAAAAVLRKGARTERGSTTTAGALLAACCLALVAAIMGAYPAHAATSSRHVSPTGAYALTPARLSAMFTPCQEEDGSGCYWDAGRAGNGAGSSFTAVVTVPGVVCVDYWTGPASEDYCTPDPYAVP